MLETLRDASEAGVKAWHEWRVSFSSMKASLAIEWRNAAMLMTPDQLRQELEKLDMEEGKLLEDPWFDEDDGFDHQAKHRIGVGKSVIGQFIRQFEAVANIVDPRQACDAFWAAYHEAIDTGLADPFKSPLVECLSRRGTQITVQCGIDHH